MVKRKELQQMHTCIFGISKKKCVWRMHTQIIIGAELRLKNYAHASANLL